MSTRERNPTTTRHWSFWENCPNCKVLRRFLVAEVKGKEPMARCPVCTRLLKITEERRASGVYEH